MAMKKILCAIVSMTFLTTTFTACSSDEIAQDASNHTTIATEDGTRVNNAFHMELMTTIDGTTFLLNNSALYYTFPELGFGITYTKPISEMKEKGKVIQDVQLPYAVGLSYLLEGKGETTPFSFSGVFRLPQNNHEADGFYEAFTQKFKHLQKICTAFDCDYYYGYNDIDEIPSATAAEKDAIQYLLDDRENFWNQIFIFPASEAPETTFEGSFKEFETYAVNGETVTQDIFKNYDLTMLNIWKTENNTYLHEIPHLVELQQQLPEDVHMMSFCVDGDSHLELLQRIIEEEGVTYPVLLPSDSLRKQVVSHMKKFPMTVFIDSAGNIVGNPLIGTPDKEGRLVETYLEEIRKRMLLKTESKVEGEESK